MGADFSVLSTRVQPTRFEHFSRLEIMQSMSFDKLSKRNKEASRPGGGRVYADIGKLRRTTLLHLLLPLVAAFRPLFVEEMEKVPAVGPVVGPL